MTRNTLLTLAGILCMILVFLVPHSVSAHEVYVLSSQEISLALHTPSVPFTTVLRENLVQFSVWALIGVMLVLGIFFLSISRFLERKLDPFFQKTKHWAPIISRITVGLSFLAGAYYQASYGPELPLTATYGAYTPVIVIILIVIGLLILFNISVRFAAIIALSLFGVAVYYHGWYMLTYVNYTGEILVLLILGASHARITSPRTWIDRIAKKLQPYSFLILRVLFGIALIFTSFYAKILYSNLGLMTVQKYDLTKYLHFDPHFLVLGAACVEILIGLFFILGIEIRFTALFLLFWLTQSLLFFGEVVWPHIILIGIPIAFIFYGYDKYSVEGYFFKRGNREPVL